MRRLNARLVFCLLAVLVPFTLVLVTDTSPKLGLDLQGGISVALAPVESGVSDGQLDKALEIVRNRVDGLGVAEPEIGRQGDNIVVDLPGIEDRQRALSIIGATAELRFRPVLDILPAEGEKLPTTTTTTAPDGATTTTAAGGTTTTTKAGTSTTKQEGRVTGAAADATTTTTAGATTTTTAAAGTGESSTTTTTAPITENPKTSKVDDPEETVVLPIRESEKDRESGQKPGRLQLGPAELLGDAVKGADAKFESQDGWGVVVDFTGDGQKGFTELTRKYLGRQVAIVLDGVVQSFPTVNSVIEGEARISGGFTKGEAEDLADTLRYGALPVALEAENTNSISPTLGRDQLRIGIVTGLVGLGLVMLYMLFYYRALGLVIWAGLGMSALSLYALVCWLGQAADLTLTLAGVTGIIVSVGYTVDSYVVYFERLKDEVRSGKTIRSSLDRGFARSFRTILTGNFVSILGAGLLYMLAIGSVRGFAFFLGLTTLLDTFVAYFFMHPLTSMLARNPKLARGKRFGVGRGLGLREATV